MSTYIKPSDVHVPKRQWQLFHVLFDGGPDESSLAIGRLDRRPALLKRENGNEKKPLGIPQSRGLPSWSVVHEQHVQQVLETRHFGFSDAKLRFARNFLNLRCVYFLTHCPTPSCSHFGELSLKTYRSSELHDRMTELDKDELQFYCIFCHEQWSPTPDEKVRLRQDMGNGLDLYHEKVRLRRRA